MLLEDVLKLASEFLEMLQFSVFVWGTQDAQIG